MAINYTRAILPSLVGIIVYMIISKLFPQEFEKDPINVTEKDPLRVTGGSQELFRELVKRYAKRILTDHALKAAIISIFFTSGTIYFQSEIESLLSDAIYKDLCKDGTAKIVDGKLKFVCNLVEELELKDHSNVIQNILIREGLSNEQKVSLLKIKLDFIINGNSPGKKRFIVMVIIGLILAVTMSGVGGLALILEALYRLFQEGKISEALYKAILAALANKAMKR